MFFVPCISRHAGLYRFPTGSALSCQVENPMAHILLVEDTPILSELYSEALTKAGHRVTIAETGFATRRLLNEATPDLILLDLQLPDNTGLDLLHDIKAAKGQATPLTIVMTAYSSINLAVEAMREGAYDFLAKPFPVERLLVTVKNALAVNQLAEMVGRLRDDAPRDRYHGFIGASPLMQSLYRIIDNVAASTASVFISGESGTGKEVCAEAIHKASNRTAKPFVALNCAAIPRDLVESEIFGHVRGAFTGATTDRAGCAVEADGGTLFLDEICEMELPLQTKLLRFLQTQTITPVGSSASRKVDLRIIAATNRDPLAEVEAGRFREDLYYRLHVVPVALPRLAERGDDVLLIAEALLATYAAEEGRGFKAFSAAAQAKLHHYSWPGNVRQLQNIIRQIVALNDGDEVTDAMLPPPLDQLAISGKVFALATGRPLLVAEAGPTAIKPLWQIERDAIEQAVEFCGGNIPRAAAILEVSPSTLYRKRGSEVSDQMSEVR
jgi:two-component system repressor protein LuxO